MRLGQLMAVSWALLLLMVVVLLQQPGVVDSWARDGVVGFSARDGVVGFSARDGVVGSWARDGGEVGSFEPCDDGVRFVLFDVGFEGIFLF